MGKSRLVRAWTAGLASLLLAGALWVPSVHAFRGCGWSPDGSTRRRGRCRRRSRRRSGSRPRRPTPARGARCSTGASRPSTWRCSRPGKVLVWSTGDNARVWNPTTGTFTLTPFTFGDLHCAGQSTLADGRVVVVGGQNGADARRHQRHGAVRPGHRDVDDGATMTDLRWYATSTTLADGKRPRDLRRRAGRHALARSPSSTTRRPNTWARLTGASGPGPVSVHVRPAQRPRVRRRFRRPRPRS